MTVSWTAADAATDAGTLALVSETAVVPVFAIVANAPVRSGSVGSLTYAALTVTSPEDADVLVVVDELPEEHALRARAAVARATAKARPRGCTRNSGDMDFPL